MFDTIFLVMIVGLMGYVLLKMLNDDRIELFPIIVVMVVMLFMLPIMGDMFDKLVNSVPQCEEERWVDCELYNIPLDQCDKDVIEEGPYYDIRTVTKYTALMCVRWEDGTILQPDDEGVPNEGQNRLPMFPFIWDD